jgi:hypothetical protein
MGMTPHQNPRGVFASEIYKNDYLQWSTRLGVSGVTLAEFVPQFSLPSFLKAKGYRTHARISMPIINRATLLSTHFDSYKLMPRHDDFGAIIDEIFFSTDYPTFYFLNLGEAHYPYMIPKEEMPPMKGDGGVLKHQGDPPPPGVGIAEYYFDMGHMKLFRERQIAAVERVDHLMGRLFEKCPTGTSIIITSDHGELFGEEGYFGHGPVFHPKVFEVPFLEGIL